MSAPRVGRAQVSLRAVHDREVFAVVRIGDGDEYTVRRRHGADGTVWRCEGCPSRRGPHGCTHTRAVEAALAAYRIHDPTQRFPTTGRTHTLTMKENP